MLSASDAVLWSYDLVMLSASVGCSVTLCSGHAISVCWLFCGRMFWSCYQRLLAVLWPSVLVMLSASDAVLWPNVLVMLSASDAVLWPYVLVMLSVSAAVLWPYVLVIFFMILFSASSSLLFSRILYVPTRTLPSLLSVLFYILILFIYSVLFSLSFIVLLSDVFSIISAVRLFPFV